MLTCKYCGLENPKEARYCQHCGEYRLIKISRDEHIHSSRLCLSMRFLILIHPRVRPR